MMKVTVCFGDMRVIVPCDNGDLLVSKIMERATKRYQKAKGENFIVQMKYLETVKESARLDPDDLVRDVCDDKDILTAKFAENERHVKIDDKVTIKFENVGNVRRSEKYHEEFLGVTSSLSDNDSGVTADASFGLSSHRESCHAPLSSTSKPPRGPHRSHVKTKNSSFNSSISSNSSSSSPELVSKKILDLNIFARDSNRKSLSFNHPILSKWIDQQEQAVFSSAHQLETDSDKSLEGEEIRLDSDSLKSIDIKPYTNAKGLEIGLIVQNIALGEENCIGELKVADRITEVNGISLLGISNESALDIFNSALASGEVLAKRTRSHSFIKERFAENVIEKMLPKSSDLVTVPKQLLKRTVEEAIDSKESAIEAPIFSEETPLLYNYFYVDLVKGSSGLGFTVTTKDVLTSKTTRIFIKNIIATGAANEDGRMQAGDELLAVNDIMVSGKSQGEVIKLLRNVSGVVSLKLTRSKGNMPKQPQEVLNTKHLAIETSGSIESLRPSLSPVLKAAVTSHIHPGPSVSPLALRPAQPPCITEQSKPEKSETDHVSNLSNLIYENCKRDCMDVNPYYNGGFLNLTVPLVIQENVGLGISVKGKIMKETGEEKGIFVKSIVPGTNAEKDGRIVIGDQLLSINEVSLRQLSNSAAMTLLKSTLSKAMMSGIIRLNVNRYVHSSIDSTESDSCWSQSMAKCGNKPRLDPKLVKSNEKGVTKLLETAKSREIISSFGQAKPSRNKSYFKALNRPISPLESQTQPLFFQPDSCHNEKTNSVQNEANMENKKLWTLDQSKHDSKLPSYEEAIEDAIDTRLQLCSWNDNCNYMAFSKQRSQSLGATEQSKLEKIQIDREISTCSHLSLDSILFDNHKFQFTRDGPGRLSMSEKKGRGQLDATKSKFYNKLKKFKSMEELRVPEGDASLEKDFMDVDIRRTTSIDTITVPLGEEEKNDSIFNRGTIYSASTPYFSSDGQRVRNEAFEAQLQRITYNHTKRKDMSDEKKKKGLLNSIGMILKRAKKRKEDELIPVHSPEYITDPDKFPFDRKALLDVYEDVENNNKHFKKVDQAQYLNVDHLQMHLVENKLKEMHIGKYQDKTKKRNNIRKEIKLNSELSSPLEVLTQSEKVSSSLSIPINKKTPLSNENNKKSISVTGYHTWRPHDPKYMREKSKQFFTCESMKSGIRSTSSLQRQHSLPPNNNIEVHRVLPRLPSGPMYKSPTSDPCKVKVELICSAKPETNSQKPSEPLNVLTKKDSHQQTKVSLNTRNNEKIVTCEQKHVDLKPVLTVMPCMKQPGSNCSHDPKTSNRRSMPSISDLKLRSSVSISHKAEI